LHSDSYNNRYGKPTSKRKRYGDAICNLCWSDFDADCKRRWYILVEYRRYDSQHYGKSDSNDYIHRYRNKRQRLHSNCHDDGYG
jgi:hypothetical protein